MATLYWIGMLAGLGVAIGTLLAGLLAPVPRGALVAGALAAVAGAALGVVLEDWPHAIAGALGGVLGALGAALIVAGSLRRGGTRGGTALLVAGAALVLAALAFVPAAGYLEALGLPALAARARRRAGETYAGLRVLARD